MTQSKQTTDGVVYGNGSTSAFVTTATFDTTTGLPLTTTDANGLETRITYDSVTLRPLNTKTYYNNTQVGGTNETIYNDVANNYWVKNRSQIDTDKWAESITYFDGLGRVWKSEQIDSGGNIFVQKEFDAQGRVSRVTNPYRSGEAQQWTTNVYDTASRIVEVDLPDTAKVLTAYGVSTTAPVGVTKTITDQAGKKRQGFSDATGNMVRVIEDPSGTPLSTDYVFDALGNLRKTTQGEQNRYFMHDSLGRLLYSKQPEQTTNTAFSATDAVTGNTAWTAKYLYDDNSNISSTTDARNNSVTASYDHLNRLTFRNYSDTTPDVNFYYDGTGLGSVPAFSKGKTTKVISGVSETRYTSFDNFGRVLTHQQITDGQTYGTAYTYNLSGALIDETYPSGRVVRNTLDANGDLSQVQSKKNSTSGFYTYAGSLTRDSAGNVKKMKLGNGKWETALYNSRLQVTQIGLGTTDTDQNLLKLEYNYGTSTQNNGSLREQKITVPTVGSNPGFTATQTYAYDDLNRLQSSTETIGGSQTWKQTFTFDRYGNRRFDAANTTTISSCASAVCNPTINTSDNRFSTGQGYSYDSNGNVTQDATSQRYAYDSENHQVSYFNASNPGSTPDATYAYDGGGLRVKKVSSLETTVFVYDASSKVVAEYSTALATVQQVSYLTTDHLGSPRITTNENGVVTNRKDFMAYGDEAISSQRVSGSSGNGYSPPSSRLDYTGYEKDTESGLEFAQARFYSSTQGRFTSVDPLMASASIKNPQTFNRYSYVLNSPYKFTDPLGLLPQRQGSGGGGGFCGAEYSSCEGGAGKAPGEAEYEARLNNTYNAIDANRAIQRGDQTTAEAICAANSGLICTGSSVNVLDDEPSRPEQFNAESRVESKWVGYLFIKGRWFKTQSTVTIPEAFRQLLESEAQWFEKTEMAYRSNVQKALAAGWDEAFVTNPAKKFWDVADQQKNAIEDRLRKGYDKFKQFVGQDVSVNNFHPRPFGGPSPGPRLATMGSGMVERLYNAAVRLGRSTGRSRSLWNH